MKNAAQQGFTSFEDLPGVDPAVESLLGQGQRRQVESHLPKNERSRKKKERERAQKRMPRRIELDLPVDLKKRLDDLGSKRRRADQPVGCLSPLMNQLPSVGTRKDQFVGIQDRFRLPQSSIAIWIYERKAKEVSLEMGEMSRYRTSLGNLQGRPTRATF